jgi:DNA-directed RNA polymerase specialized sigma24 family protein
LDDASEGEAVDHEAALLELPTAHAVALRLHDAGVADEGVAQALGIPVTSVAGLLRIAEAKLAAALGRTTFDE